jgi:hypothetical protein
MARSSDTNDAAAPALATVAAYVRRKLAEKQFPRSVANIAVREAID